MEKYGPITKEAAEIPAQIIVRHKITKKIVDRAFAPWDLAVAKADKMIAGKRHYLRYQVVIVQK